MATAVAGDPTLSTGADGIDPSVFASAGIVYAGPGYSSWAVGDGSDNSALPIPPGRYYPILPRATAGYTTGEATFWTGIVTPQGSSPPSNVVDQLGRPVNLVQATSPPWFTPADAVWCQNKAYATDPIQSASYDRMCRGGEWYYVGIYKIQGAISFPDEMTPGCINIGMMDGSVQSITKNISVDAWNALMTGQAPSNDASDW